jgi:hypothetical protein
VRLVLFVGFIVARTAPGATNVKPPIIEGAMGNRSSVEVAVETIEAIVNGTGNLLGEDGSVGVRFVAVATDRTVDGFVVLFERPGAVPLSPRHSSLGQ